MAEVTGQTKYNFGGEPKAREPFMLPEIKEWEAICRFRGVQVQPASPKNKKREGLPWISGLQFELVGSAPNENAKNQRIYHSRCLRVSPNDGGYIAVDGADAIKGLMVGLGIPDEERPQFSIKNQGTLSGKSFPILNPDEVKAWLIEQDGKAVKLINKVRKDQNDPTKEFAVVERFIPAESLFASGSSDAPADEPAAEEDEAPEEEAPKPAPKKGGKKK